MSALHLTPPLPDTRVLPTRLTMIPTVNRGRRGSIRGIGQPNINQTTIWTPQTGFLNQPGTLTQGYQFKPQVTSVYDVPGLLLPYQNCLDPMGGSGGSQDCVKQNLAIEAENFQRTAAYNAGTLKLPTVDPATGEPPTTSTPPAPTPPKPPATTPAPTPQTQNTGGTTSQTSGDGSTNGGRTGGTSTTPATTDHTVYWILGGVAALALVVAVMK